MGVICAYPSYIQIESGREDDGERERERERDEHAYVCI